MLIYINVADFTRKYITRFKDEAPTKSATYECDLFYINSKWTLWIKIRQHYSSMTELLLNKYNQNWDNVKIKTQLLTNVWGI